MQNFEFKNPTEIQFGRGMIAKLESRVPTGVPVLLLYGGGSAWLLIGIRRELKHGLKPFAGTLAEFEKDRACFRAGR